MKTYNIFISHSWSYSDNYNKLINLLKQTTYFDFKDYSVPKNDPLYIYSSSYYESELKNKIENQMRPCSVILILAGVYASYSKSISMEIDIAKKLGKPIIAIECWGAERTSTIVKNNATIVVRWNATSIIDAIRRYSN